MGEDDSGPVDVFLNLVDGLAVPGQDETENLKCDFCSSVIYPNTRVTHYASDHLTNQEYVPPDADTQPFFLLRIYCSECNRKTLRYPCQGYAELIIESDIDRDYRISDPDIIDVSGHEEGYPWDPVAVWEVTHPNVTWGQQNVMQIPLGPEDIVDDLVYFGIDIREVVNENGEIIVDDETRKKIEQQILSTTKDLFETG